MDDATRGTKALSASDFASAIKHFTRALTVNPHATDYYIKRSTAYLRLKPEDGGPDGEAALRDAEMAVALGIRRARRELIIAGQMRRAIVLYHLGRFGDADYLFKILREKLGGVENPNSKDKAMSAMGMTEKATAASEASRKNQELQIWEIKVKSQLNKLESGDDKAKVTIQEVPDLVVPTPEELKTAHQVRLQELERGVAPSASSANVEEIRNTKGMGKTSTRQSQNVVSPLQSEEDQSNKAPANVPTTQTANKVRHEWYQSHDAVVLTLYAKNVPKDKAEIDIQEHSVSLFSSAFGTSLS